MIIYIATPYAVPNGHRTALLQNGYRESDLDDLMRWRARAATRATAVLQHGAAIRKLPLLCYTPIGYENLLLDDMADIKNSYSESIRSNAAYWMEIDHKILTVTDALVVVGLPGWSASQGIAEELATMSKMIGVDIAFVPYKDYNILTNAIVRRINTALTELDAIVAPPYGVPVYATMHELLTHYREKRHKYA